VLLYDILASIDMVRGGQRFSTTAMEFRTVVDSELVLQIFYSSK
jgi:hypothetical protein